MKYNPCCNFLAEAFCVVRCYGLLGWLHTLAFFCNEMVLWKEYIVVVYGQPSWYYWRFLNLKNLVFLLQ